MGGGRYGDQSKKLVEQLNAVLFDKFGVEKIIEEVSAGSLFYDLNILNKIGLEAGEIDEVISPILLKTEWIDKVIPATVLESNRPLTNFEQRYRNSHHMTISGDLYYVPKPHWISKFPYGASHGTPYDWDSHVPIIFAGNRIQRKTVLKGIMTVDFAPTIAAKLGLEIPSNIDGKPLDLSAVTRD